MSEQQPADWYTDPDDESQYRYWDGSAWTEHRAPRHAEPAGDLESAGGLRGPGTLIGDSLSMLRRQWRGFSLAALVNLAGGVAVIAVLIVTVNRILMGELSEIWDRITEPGFDPEAPGHKAYFESLEVDLSASSFVPVVAVLLIVWIVGALVTVAVTRLALGDLRGQAPGLPDLLREALGRTPRLIGVELQVMMIAVLAVAILILPVIFEPWLLLLTIPVMVAAVFLSVPVISIAYVAAAVGPAKPAALRYAVRVVRRRYWGVMGRLLLIGLILSAIGYGAGLAFGLLTAASSQLWNLAQLGNALVGSVLGLVGTAAAAIIYYDLGGEPD